MTTLRSSLKKCAAEATGNNKSEEQKEMECLLESLPVLNDYFQLHSKIGQGTFSTVYLATLRNSSSTQKYAVKHLTQACEESRIQNELRCLREIGGKDNVVPAELCLSNGENCVTFIMPYLAHRRFSDYVIDMDAEETRFYMKNLFIALKRVHSFNIIHRDVKPNNFLYNRETKQFLLVDFGLAQLVRTPNQGNSKSTTSLDENRPIDYSRKRKRSRGSSDDEKKSPIRGKKRIALKLKDNNAKVSPVPDEIKTEIEKVATRGKGGLNSPLKAWANEPDIDETLSKSINLKFSSTPSSNRKKLLQCHDSGLPSKNSPKNQSNGSIKQNNSFTPLVFEKSSSGNFVQIRNSRVIRQQTLSLTPKPNSLPRGTPSTSFFSQPCLCSGKAAVCSVCSSMQPMFAPRAGTSGFRPPEVLFKHLHQTTAVDMWASGVIMLCILSGCYPFFNSSSDLASLAEIMTIFGTERTINVAKKFGRRILCSEYRKEIDLKKLCKRLRARSARRSRREKSISNEPKCRDCFQAIRDDGCLCRSDLAACDYYLCALAKQRLCSSENIEKWLDDWTVCLKRAEIFHELGFARDGENGGQAMGNTLYGNGMEMSNEEEGLNPKAAVGPFWFPDSAYDLLYRLLDLDPTSRITAAEALEHPFITGQK